MTSLAIKEKEIVARPLKVLVSLIKDEIAHGREAAEEAAKPFYQCAGELLLEAKSQVARGEWEPWLKRNFDFNVQTARRWIAYAKALPEYQIGRAASVFTKPPTLSEITTPDRDRASEPSSSWQAPVRELLAGKITDNFVERIAQDRQNKEKETQLMRQLANQLIDIGYKVLATQLHPDKGGSPEAMNRLNRVRSLLKDAI